MKKDPIEFNGNKVYQRNDLFDPTLTWWQLGVIKGKYSVELILSEWLRVMAPIGYDGKVVNFHHMLQAQNGLIAEMSQTFHKTNRELI